MITILDPFLACLGGGIAGLGALTALAGTDRTFPLSLIFALYAAMFLSSGVTFG